jgi:hypothetical protein
VVYFAQDGQTIVNTELVELADSQLLAVAQEPGSFTLEDEVGAYLLRSTKTGSEPRIEFVLQ